MSDPFYLGAHYVNNFWIKDPTNYSTHKLNYDNAELSMALSGLHNISFNSFATMPQMDIGTMLSAFWNNAFKAANAEFAQMMMFMPSFNAGGAFQMPGMAQGIGAMTGGTATGTGSSIGSGAKILDENLTEQQIERAKTLQTQFKEKIEKYEKLDEDTKKALGLNKILEEAKKEFDLATNPTKIEECTNKLDEALKGISQEKIKSVFITKNPYKPGVVEDSKFNVFYGEASALTSIAQQLEGGIAALITDKNIIAEMDKRITIGEDYNILYLLKKNPTKADDKKLVINMVNQIIGDMLTRANSEIVKDDANVKDAASKLRTIKSQCKDDKSALNTYTNTVNNSAKLLEAFEDTYIAIKKAEAKHYDEQLKDELPEVLLELCDENVNLNTENVKTDIEKINTIRINRNAEERAYAAAHDFTPSDRAGIYHKNNAEWVYNPVTKGMVEYKAS